MGNLNANLGSNVYYLFIITVVDNLQKIVLFLYQFYNGGGGLSKYNFRELFLIIFHNKY